MIAHNYDSQTERQNQINPFTAKISLLILLSSSYVFPCQLFKRIWWLIKKNLHDKFEHSHQLFAG